MRTSTAIRWTAHALSIAGTLLLLAFTFGGRESLRFTAMEAAGFLCFPIGIVAGFVIAWRRAMLGGTVTLASLALFYGWMFARDGRIGGPYFLAFGLPGFLYLASVYVARRERDEGGEGSRDDIHPMPVNR